MEQLRAQAREEDYHPIRRRCCYGAAQFRQELLAHLDGQLGSNHFGEELKGIRGTEIRRKEVLHWPCRERTTHVWGGLPDEPENNA